MCPPFPPRTHTALPQPARPSPQPSPLTQMTLLAGAPAARQACAFSIIATVVFVTSSGVRPVLRAKDE